MGNAREEAIADCKYALSLGKHALNEHIVHWTGVTAQAHKPLFDKDEYSYFVAMNEIKRKLGGDECLLK